MVELLSSNSQIMFILTMESIQFSHLCAPILQIVSLCAGTYKYQHIGWYIGWSAHRPAQSHPHVSTLESILVWTEDHLMSYCGINHEQQCLNPFKKTHLKINSRQTPLKLITVLPVWRDVEASESVILIKELAVMMMKQLRRSEMLQLGTSVKCDNKFYITNLILIYLNWRCGIRANHKIPYVQFLEKFEAPVTNSEGQTIPIKPSHK